MKVKIGNTIYNAENEPIMLIFETDEQRKVVGEQICNMSKSDTIRKYVQFPDIMTANEILEFMKI